VEIQLERERAESSAHLNHMVRVNVMYRYVFEDYTLRGGKKGAICPFGSRNNPFEFHLEPITKRVLYGTQKSSTWNQKGFPMGTVENPFWNSFV
jgi:hypothetical protein